MDLFLLSLLWEILVSNLIVIVTLTAVKGYFFY